MEKTNTNTHKKRKIVALLLCMALAITSIAGAALAKYTTNVSANDTASVAKWHFEVNDVNMTPADGEAAMTFDLFKTIMDTDGASAETDVKTDLIAPGTSGKFDVKIENLSEVNAVYSLDYSIENTSNVPLQFSLDGADWKSDINDLDVSDVAIAMGSGSDTVTVQWKWAFNGDDAADTALGIAAQTAAPTVKVTCAATFTQVD
jgi:hypothetical protein